MEVTDTNIINLIIGHELYDLDQSIINKLGKIQLLGRSGYYWNNILLSLTKYPHVEENEFCKFIVNAMNEKFNQSSLQDVLVELNTYYVESILQECKNMRPTHMSMPLVPRNDIKVVNPIVIKNLKTNSQKNSMITHMVPTDKNQAIQFKRSFIPVIENQPKLDLANLFMISPFQIWYPLDTEGFPILRCVFHLLLRRYGLDISFLNMSKTVREDQCLGDYANLSFIQFCEYFISQIPKKGRITEELLNHFKKGLYRDKSPLYSLIIQLAQDIQRASHSTYSMNNLNANIISRVKKILDISTENTKADICTTSTESIEMQVIQQTIRCHTSLNAQEIVQVLSNYPNLKDGSNIISLELCPIKSKYVLSIFPYYKGKHITVQDSIISIKAISGEEYSDKSSRMVLPKVFKDLKKCVTFDGNYENFRTLIKSINIDLNEQIAIYSIFYNLNGFSCTTIAAEIINHCDDIFTNSENMYHLLSKLTPFEIRTLDNTLENTCKLDETKIEPMDLLFKYSLYQGRSISTKKVEYAMKKLLNTPNFVSKINVILSQNYKFVASEVIYYYQHQSSINSEGRECIKLLLLYSDVSDVLKKWIYNSLSKQSISKDDLDTACNSNFSKNNYIQYCMNQLSIYEIYKMGIDNGYNLKNYQSDLLQYVQQTKDWIVLELLQVM